MICTISTPPGNPVFALQTSAFTPLLALPFDDGNGLQSNACTTPRSTKASSYRHKQIGLGLLFSGFDSFLHADSSQLPVNDVLLEDPLLNSHRQLPISNDASAQSPAPAEASCSRCSCCLVDADLGTSSSAFSIGDWIVHPSSSPVPSDATCGLPNSSHDIESTPSAVPGSPGTVPNLHPLGVASTAPGTPAGINPAILTIPRIRSPFASTDSPRGSIETALLQVVEHLCLSHIPATSRLSPGQTPFPRRDHASFCTSERPTAHSLEVMCSGTGSHLFSGDLNLNLFSIPVDTLGESTSADAGAVGAALASPQNMLPLNGGEKSPLVSPDTPIFNIHEGISECDLQRRANRYRRRYPGRSLDRHWLLRYAGKLNQDGVAIENYRCYISGCAQVNKRRDHIIVHICSHVNERPFACRHWLLPLYLSALTAKR